MPVLLGQKCNDVAQAFVPVPLGLYGPSMLGRASAESAPGPCQGFGQTVKSRNVVLTG